MCLMAYTVEGSLSLLSHGTAGVVYPRFVDSMFCRKEVVGPI